MKRTKLFIAEIEILENVWGETYKKGMRLFIPVIASNLDKAITFLDKRHFGSEYPEYKVLQWHLEDPFLFKAILTKEDRR